MDGDGQHVAISDAVTDEAAGAPEEGAAYDIWLSGQIRLHEPFLHRLSESIKVKVGAAELPQRSA